MSEKDIQQIIDGAVSAYKGDARVLESAIGALMLGQRLGRRPLLLIHGGTAIRKYQNILKVEFKDVMPEDGPFAHKSVGYGIAKKIGYFWASVAGTAPGRSPDLTA